MEDIEQLKHEQEIPEEQGAGLGYLHHDRSVCHRGDRPRYMADVRGPDRSCDRRVFRLGIHQCFDHRFLVRVPWSGSGAIEGRTVTQASVRDGTDGRGAAQERDQRSHRGTRRMSEPRPPLLLGEDRPHG